jgi:YVTN family beta-propeller protein
VFRRRSFLAATLGLSACSYKSKQAFDGYAFIATRDSGDIAVVDLAAYALQRRIKTASRPLRLLDQPGSASFLAFEEDGSTERIELPSLKATRLLSRPLSPQNAFLSFDQKTLWALSLDGRELLAIELAGNTVAQKWALPGVAASLAVSPETAHVAVSLPGSQQLGILREPSQTDFTWTALPRQAGLVRFIKNGSMVIVAQPEAKQLSLIDSASSRVIVHLPLPVQPANFCFSDDGGQLFLTGDGLDAVVVVDPYHSQVAATLLSGKAPGPMAVSTQPEYLFVTSPSTDTVSVLSIASRKLAAVVAVGSEPRGVVITPDNSMALVLNQRSGDLAIIRLANIVSKRNKTAPLFTMIPVGSAPVSAVVRTL